ncbi:MAG: hypothetical protein U9R79_19190 [Armatimonadota bacterium]|nr:hypothetical protein [Chloroflexota bacterium]MEA3403377.1 hypothetical protein [Armatimonadota bacterium]
MGGRGSGTWYRTGTKQTTAGIRRLDVRDLQREGVLVAGKETQWAWWDSQTGERTAWIRIIGGEKRVVLRYRWRLVKGGWWGAGDWQDVEEIVPIERTPCNFGGSRPWFRCPGVVNGVHCGRRVAILYGAEKYFLCRHCYDLAYETQRMDEAKRLQHKAQKIRMRLGGEPGTAHPFPPKPKHMHWDTYERLRREAEQAADRSLILTVAKFDEHMRRLVALEEEYSELFGAEG